MRRTKIIATLGPASRQVEQVVALARAGMDVARINLSHATLEELEHQLAVLKEAQETLDKPLGVMLDTRGPEIRVGEMPEGGVELATGDPFFLSVVEMKGSKEGAGVNYPRLTEDVDEGDLILLDDGNIQLQVERVEKERVHCRVTAGGRLVSRKKVSLPQTHLSLPPLAPEDERDIRTGIEHGVDFIAASFIRSADDVLAVRRVIEEAGGDQMLIAKIETRLGVDHLDEILRAADGIMVARGDLGVEFPTEEVPLIQKRIIRGCNALGKPVITATQMLESMIQHARPTRAEATDVANAIFDGTDAVMLSGETAVGEYPTEAVAVMARIAARTEQALPFDEILAQRVAAGHETVTDAISYATCTTARDLHAAAIITATASGHTARMVAKNRPQAPILAMTPSPRVVRRLTVSWGVHPFRVPMTRSTDEMIDASVTRALEVEAVRQGDLVVITAGVPVGVSGTTNLLQVHTVGKAMLKGTGIGRTGATGRVCIVRNPEEATDFREGDILVAAATDRDFVPLIERAAAVITEEGGLTSHAAVVALSLGKPAVVGAADATRVLQNDITVTVDAQRGLVYRGKVRVV